MVIKRNKEIIEIIDSYILLLLEAGYPIERVYLFGSYARDEYDENSDIDVAVVFKELNTDRFTARLKLLKYCRNFDVVIEPHPFASKDFTREDPFVTEIIDTGIEVYDYKKQEIVGA